MTDNEVDIINRLGRHIQSHDVSNEFLVHIIELGFNFLNAETISNYSKLNNMSYNGVKKYRNIKTIRGVKFVIDNE